MKDNKVINPLTFYNKQNNKDIENKNILKISLNLKFFEIDISLKSKKRWKEYILCFSKEKNVKFLIM